MLLREAHRRRAPSQLAVAGDRRAHHRAAPAGGSRSSRLDHREHDARLVRAAPTARCPKRAQPFRAGALEELEVVGVVDDAAAVRIFPVDARRPEKLASPRRPRTAAGSPRGARALSGRSAGRRVRVAMRPRAVRIRKPCWIRYGSITSSSVPRSSPTAAAMLSMPTGPPSNFSMIVSRNLRSSVSKPCGSTSSRSSAAPATRLIDAAVRLHLRVVAHAAQQAVGDARRAARALRDAARAGCIDAARSRMPAERVTMRSRSSTP